MKNYSTSDYHLAHQNVIKYDKRPFKYAVGEMDEYILDLQNDIVTDDDNFYFLGDFCFDFRRTEKYLSRLKGKLFFIKGNHDNRQTTKLFSKYGIYLGEQCKITIDDQDIILNHYGMRVWNKSHHGSWHLYGHSHGSLPPLGKSIDVGCMIHKYRPLEFSEIKTFMDSRNISKEDHHK